MLFNHSQMGCHFVESTRSKHAFQFHYLGLEIVSGAELSVRFQRICV